MTTGEGGMVTTNSHEMNKWLRIKLGHGIERNSYFDEQGNSYPWNRNAVMAGHNFRLSNLQSALGIVQLSKLEQMNEKRNFVARTYDQELKNVVGLKLPSLMSVDSHSYQMYVIRVSAGIRNSFVQYLNSKGIGASVHFDPPVHKQSVYLSNLLELTATEDFSSQCISLPISSTQSLEDTMYVVDAIKSFVG
jgi:dTDP-4-amino-4,6-dideoxygalactose transaminase